MSQVTALGVLGALLLLAPGASAKVHNYRVKVTFTQTRPSSYYHQLATPECTRTEQGHGLDVVKLSVTLPFIPVHGPAPFAMVGTYTRTGVMTHTVTGSQCAASAVFPSTWRIDTTVDGTVTASEPNTGCGPKAATVNYGKLEFAGSHLIVAWDRAQIPEFEPCPFIEHSNDASPSHTLPGPNYRDVVLNVPRGQLRAGKRHVTASGESKKAATETCANLTGPCPVGVTYNATASVDSSSTAVFTRVGR
jgi:hypothetical protein